MMITRRCTQREFWLRPDKETNANFTYCLAEAAARFDISVILSQMESNHHHTIVWDPHANQVLFREHFHKMLAKSQNVLRRRGENLWAAVEPSVVEIEPSDLLEKLVYVATNPVKDNLVEEVAHWPGPKFVQALLTGKTLKAKRPWWFFSKASTMPAEAELVFKLPDHLENKEQLLAALKERIADVEARAKAARARTGMRVMGRGRVLRQRPSARPNTRAPQRELNPRFAVRDPERRIVVLGGHGAWRSDYQDARRAMLSKQPYAFPYGTYWLPRFAAAIVKPSPQ